MTGESKMIGKTVIIRCKSSHWDGHVGYVTSCFTNPDTDWERLYTVRLHSTSTSSRGEVLYACRTDMAIEELEITYAQF